MIDVRCRAAGKVRKLLTVTAERGATDGEADAARARARILIDRYELAPAEYAPEPERLRPHIAPPAPTEAPFVGFAFGGYAVEVCEDGAQVFVNGHPVTVHGVTVTFTTSGTS